MDSLDKAIEAVSNKIQKELQEENSNIKKAVELTNALAALVTARANLKMASRAYASGGTNRNRYDV